MPKALSRKRMSMCQDALRGMAAGVSIRGGY
jgi:hypothetical protein